MHYFFESRILGGQWPKPLPHISSNSLTPCTFLYRLNPMFLPASAAHSASRQSNGFNKTSFSKHLDKLFPKVIGVLPTHQENAATSRPHSLPTRSQHLAYDTVMHLQASPNSSNKKTRSEHILPGPSTRSLGSIVVWLCYTGENGKGRWSGEVC